MEAYLRNPWVQAIAASVAAYYGLQIVRPALLINADGSPKYPMFSVPVMSGMVGVGVLAAYTAGSRRGVGSPVAVVQPALTAVGVKAPAPTGATPLETALLSSGEF
jgi:hypothetical protein